MMMMMTMMMMIVMMMVMKWRALFAWKGERQCLEMLKMGLSGDDRWEIA
jgi:hypothetical protein